MPARPAARRTDAVELARTRMLPAVAGEQPGLTGRHPSLLARDPPPFAQQFEKVGRENDIPVAGGPQISPSRTMRS
jgi:hypothetical protein